MADSIKETEKITRLDIEDSITIYDVISLRERILAALEGSEGIELDLSNVKECDTAGIQLLYSLKMSIQRLNRKLIVRGLSDCVKTSLKRTSMHIDMITVDQRGAEK